MRRWINLLNEKWITSHDTSFGINEVFENPSKQLVSKLLAKSEYGVIKGVIVPRSGDVYVWSNEEIEHREVEEHIRKEGIRLFFNKYHGLEFENDDFDVYNIGGDHIDPIIERIAWLNQQPNILRANGGPIGKTITEARSNPELNPRHHPLDQLKQLRDEHGPDLFVSFTMEFKFKKQRAPAGTKLGINPRSTFSTPLGVYCYPIDFVIDFTEESNDEAGDMYNQFTGGLDAPFTGYNAWGKAFVFKINGRKLSDDMPMSEYYLGMEMLKDILGYDEEQMRQFTYYSEKRSKGQKPCFLLWNATRYASVTMYEHRKDTLIVDDKDNRFIALWNTVLRKLGYAAAVDAEGLGFIHDNEPTQAVVFDPSAIRAVSVVNRYEGDERMFYSIRDRIRDDPRLLEKLPRDTVSRIPIAIMKFAIEDYLDTRGSFDNAVSFLVNHNESEKLIANLLSGLDVSRSAAIRAACAAYSIAPSPYLARQFNREALAIYVIMTDYKIDKALGKAIAEKSPDLLPKLLQKPERVEDMDTIAHLYSSRV